MSGNGSAYVVDSSSSQEGAASGTAAPFAPPAPPAQAWEDGAEEGGGTKGTDLHSPVTSVDDALRLIRMGNKNRATSATNANEHSSRSHAIVTLHIEVTSTEGQSNITSTTKKKQARFARRGRRTDVCGSASVVKPFKKDAVACSKSARTH